MAFHEILSLCSFLKSFEKNEVLLKSEKNNGYFTGIFHVLRSKHTLRIMLYLNALHVLHVSSCSARSIQGVPGGMDKTSGECSLC